jgi:hypothetical protein
MFAPRGEVKNGPLMFIQNRQQEMAFMYVNAMQQQLKVHESIMEV